jgi:hypothetical protein
VKIYSGLSRPSNGAIKQPFSNIATFLNGEFFIDRKMKRSIFDKFQLWQKSRQIILLFQGI